MTDKKPGKNLEGEKTIQTKAVKPANAEQNNGQVFYGDSSKVNQLNYSDYNDYLLKPKTGPDMPGFDKDYKDIVDYILKITHRIWEERSIGLINDTYHNNTIVHTCSATNSGVLPVVASTLSALHAFPNRRIVAESVIWSEDSPGYYFTSHRSKSSAQNLGDSEFGKVTGKKVQFRAIADCMMTDNRIYEEWLVRDNIWLVQQLGLDPIRVAKDLAKKYVANGSPAFKGNFGISESMEGQFYPVPYQAKDDSVGEWIKELHRNIFGCKLIDQVKDYFSPQATVHFIGNKVLCGKEEIQGAIISFLASFPNAYMMIDRITCNERVVKGEWDVAVRWKLKGLHEGTGLFGDPSGNMVHIMGINHYHIKNNQIKEGWIMFDGIDVLRQIVTGKEETETDVCDLLDSAE